MGNIPPGMGYRNRSELTPKQARTLYAALIRGGFDIINGNDLRTARSLVNKGYAQSDEDWNAIYITDDGRAWCKNHDKKGRIR